MNILFRDSILIWLHITLIIALAWSVSKCSKANKMLGPLIYCFQTLLVNRIVQFKSKSICFVIFAKLLSSLRTKCFLVNVHINLFISQWLNRHNFCGLDRVHWCSISTINMSYIFVQDQHFVIIQFMNYLFLVFLIIFFCITHYFCYWKAWGFSHLICRLT